MSAYATSAAAQLSESPKENMRTWACLYRGANTLPADENAEAWCRMGHRSTEAFMFSSLTSAFQALPSKSMVGWMKKTSAIVSDWIPGSERLLRFGNAGFWFGERTGLSAHDSGLRYEGGDGIGSMVLRQFWLEVDISGTSGNGLWERSCADMHMKRTIIVSRNRSRKMDSSMHCDMERLLRDGWSKKYKRQRFEEVGFISNQALSFHMSKFLNYSSNISID